MRKRLLALAITLAFACLLTPGFALADEESTAAAVVTIEIGEEGAPVSASGSGWTYENNVLTLKAEYAFTFSGHACDVRVINGGSIQSGVFNGTVHNASNDDSSGTIAGSTFNGYVYNYEGGVVSGGTFNDGGYNNSVTNYGTIRGGEFNVNVDSRGTIEDGTFNDGAQNYEGGTVLGGTFGGEEFFNSGVISDGMFGSETTYHSGEIRGGTFDKAVESDGGTISGGTFASTGSVLSYYGGIISGGTFNGSVSNCDSDFDPEYNRATITGGTFKNIVVNYDAIEAGTFLGDVINRGVIEGGFFARAVVDAGGTMSAGSYPVTTSLTGLSIAQTRDAELVATYEKDSDESNRYTLAADKGYTLPDAISVRYGMADRAELVEGADYTYDAATGTIDIPKRLVTGPLFLIAVGAPTTAPPPPTPTDPETPDTPKPETPPMEPSTPTPLPMPTDTGAPTVTSEPTVLVSTGDPALPQITLSIVLLAGSTLLACAVTRWKRSRG